MRPSTLAAVLIALTTGSAFAAPKKPATAKRPAAAAAPAQQVLPPQPSGEREARQIVLNPERKGKRYAVTTAIGHQVSLLMPERILEYVCGDCYLPQPLNQAAPAEGAPAAGPGDELFVATTNGDGTMLIIKPRQMPAERGGVVPLAEFNTIVTVTLASKAAFLVEVQLKLSKDEADGAVAFLLPDRQKEQGFVAQETERIRKELEASMAARIEAETTKHFLRKLNEPHECRGATAHARQNGLLLEVLELCRFGSNVYVRFRIENRAAALFTIDELEVRRKEGVKGTPVSEPQQLLGSTELPFNQQTGGVVGFVGDGAGAVYELQLSERGGQGRQVLVSDIRF